MADDGFKLPGSSYAELVKIIRAYAHAPTEASPKEVADRAAIDKTQVSRNNGFLVSVGVLEGGNKKSLTSRGRALANALDLEMPSEISSAWRAVTEESDFLRKVVSAVRIRGGMETSTLRSHIAFTAGVPKKATSMAGAGSVIDSLLVSGLLREQDGKILATQASESSPVDRTEPISARRVPVQVQSTNVQVLDGSAPPVSIQIQLRVVCSEENLEELGTKLRAFLRDLRVGPSAEDTPQE